jgi:hypothetical protein
LRLQSVYLAKWVLTCKNWAWYTESSKKKSYTYVKGKGLTTRNENVGQKLYCFFLSPDLLGNLNEMVINVRWYCHTKSKDFEKKLKLKWASVKSWVRGNLTAID